MSFDQVLSDFVAAVREAGLPASPVEAIDVSRAALTVGLSRRGDLRAALRAALVKDPEHLPAFERTFAAFFRVGDAGGEGLFSRLEAAGLDAAERRALEEAIEAADAAAGRSGGGLSAVAAGGTALDPLLREAARSAGVAAIRTQMQVGFYTQRVLERAGLDALGDALASARAALEAQLGARGAALADALAHELSGLRAAARAVVSDELERRNSSRRERFRRRTLEERSFRELSPREVEQVAIEVRRFAERLRGRISVRRRRRRRGQLDPRRTTRRSFRTGGVPFQPVFRRRRMDRPRLVLLCDVSDSVRPAARFLLLLVYAIQEAFSRTRSYVFVADLGEATDLFEHHPVEQAIELAWGGAAADVASNSDYGRAFGVFARQHLAAVDGRTTVVVLGDGRNNYLDPNVSAFAAMHRRARRILWLNPEPAPSWGFGDSAMTEYLPFCEEARTVHNLATLRAAVDRILASASRPG